MKKVVFIAGPTAAGKSGFAHTLIDKYFPDASIVSADAFQVYKGLNVGTAKPSLEEILKYRYSLVDFISPNTPYSVSNYYIDALSIIEKIKEPIFVVGGTGLYIRTLKEGVFDEVDDGGKTRIMLEKRLEEEGLASLVKSLKECDEESFLSIDTQNPRRVIRALEVCIKCGVAFSKARTLRKKPPIKHKTYIIDIPRNILYEKINQRVVSMFENSLVKEVEGLLKNGVDKSANSLQAIGYKEVVCYLEKEISLDEAISMVKQNTRHFAKRQITWFKKEEGRWISKDDLESVASQIKEFYEE